MIVYVPAADGTDPWPMRERAFVVLAASSLTGRYPTFHRASDEDHRVIVDGEPRRPDTCCGRILDFGATWMPVMHALLFARPCARCFP